MTAASIVLVGAFLLEPLEAQSPEFDVASVKQNKSDERPQANLPFGPGDIYVANAGLFSAKNFPPITYIAFAYKITAGPMALLRPQFPPWVTTDRYDIQARAEGNPTKDQMRLIMRALLAERFKLAIHIESRQVSTYVLVLVKPAKTGPQLQPHPDDASCPSAATPPPEPVINGFPALCGGNVRMRPSAPGRIAAAGRNVPVKTIADGISAWSGLGKPVVDQTGLTGTFDYKIEWAPESDGPAVSGFIPNAPPGPVLQEALETATRTETAIAQRHRRIHRPRSHRAALRELI